MKGLRSALGIVVAIAVVLGFKFYNKSSTADDVKEVLVGLCESDAECLEAVDQHFKECFDENYKMGGRRTSAKLDTEGIVNCVNQRSGMSYFAFEG